MIFHIFHNWTIWETVFKVYPDGSRTERQRRKCVKCNYVEQYLI